MAHLRTCLIFFAVISAAHALEPKQIASGAFPSIVVIETYGSSGRLTGMGTGFAIADDLVATSLHVVSRSDDIRLRSLEGQSSLALQGYVAADEANDLVILKTDPHGLAPLSIGNDESLVPGDPVYVIGHPFGLEGTFSAGMVSAKREFDGRSIIQVTAPISPGNSGGPVLNAIGEIIGISVAYIQDGQNLSFATPVSFLRYLLANQHDPKAMNDGLPSVTRTIRDQGTASSETIMFGNISVSLGMNEKIAREELERFYDFNPAGDETFMVYEPTDKPERVHWLGTIVFRDGEVAALMSRERWDTATGESWIQLYKLLHEQTKKDMGECITLLDYSKPNRTYFIRYIFPSREIRLGIHHSRLDNSVLIDVNQYVPPDPRDILPDMLGPQVGPIE